jgi:hypothetical protein
MICFFVKFLAAPVSHFWTGHQSKDVICRLKKEKWHVFMHGG